MIPRLYVPVLEPGDVVRHLGKKEKHWKAGRSAHALASLWCKHNDFPPNVRAALNSNPQFQSAELIDAFLERQVDLGSDGRPSQTDLLVVAGLRPDQLAILAVEGKAGESFSQHVHAWRDGSEKKEKRLESLCELLGLSPDRAMPLRYQLLHRMASAILEAQRYRTNIAALLVHSFAKDHEGFADFSAFLQAVGFGAPTYGVLVGPVVRGGVSVYAGWVEDKPQNSPTSAYLDDLRAYTTRIAEDCDRVLAWCDERQSKHRTEI
jgi:hypothetical protein